MNNWNFTGNIGKDCETRHTPSGDAVVSFSVAVKSGYGDKAVTSWANCQMWGKRGEAVAQYLTKGQLVGVCGEVTLRPWKDKEGNERQSLDVRVNDLTLLGARSAEPRTEPAQSAKPAADPNDFSDDIPF